MNRHYLIYQQVLKPWAESTTGPSHFQEQWFKSNSNALPSYHCTRGPRVPSHLTISVSSYLNVSKIFCMVKYSYHNLNNKSLPTRAQYLPLIRLRCWSFSWISLHVIGWAARGGAVELLGSALFLQGFGHTEPPSRHTVIYSLSVLVFVWSGSNLYFLFWKFIYYSKTIYQHNGQNDIILFLYSAFIRWDYTFPSSTCWLPIHAPVHCLTDL